MGLGDIEMGDRGMGEGRAKAITVACHQGRTSARPQTFTLQDKLSLFILHVILLKGSLSLSPLSPINRGPLLLSMHHYGSGSKNGSEENLSYQTAMRLGSWMQPPRKSPSYMTSLVLWTQILSGSKPPQSHLAQ